MQLRVDLRVLSILLGLVVILILAGAQAGQSSVVGQVNDESVGATVTLVSSSTGLTRTVHTGYDGAFSITNLPPGPYTPTDSWDIRLLKGVRLGRISDRARLEGLVDVFNLTKYANNGQNYFDAIDQPNFGKPINIITPPRTAQLGVKFSF